MKKCQHADLKVIELTDDLVKDVETTWELIFPMLFFGNPAFMFSTITRSGNGTAVLDRHRFIVLYYHERLRRRQRAGRWRIYIPLNKYQ